MRAAGLVKAAGLAAAVLLAHALPATGQVVRGRLVERGQDIAVATAMMSLTDSAGALVAQTLTRRNGLFHLAASGPGSYRLRADRIGYATTFSDFFALAAGDTLALDMEVPVEAIALAGLTAEGDGRCRMRPEDGLAVAKVWEEARKALAAAAWTQERGMYRYEMLRTRLELDPEGRRVVSEKRKYEDEYRKAPFVSAPAEDLVSQGFAILSSQESFYRAPDAGVLLSDPFLDTHCFRLAERRRAGLVGLEFEPVPGRRVAEIEGTLWLDESSARLQRLDFRYRNLNLPDELVDADPGGWVEFKEMPNGTWIVESWRIRMPKPGVRNHWRTGRAVATLDGITVEGGDVLEVHGADEEVVAPGSDAGGRIAGIVFDSLQGGLEGAQVFVEGANYAVTANREGRFEIAHLSPGLYSLNFSVPYFERLSYWPEPLEVEVKPDGGAPAQANFSAPSMERAADAVCLETERSEADWSAPGRERPHLVGVLAGRVADSMGNAVPGAVVAVVSTDRDVERTSAAGMQVRRGRTVVATTANAAGRYVVCRLPVDASLEVHAWRPSAGGELGLPKQPSAGEEDDASAAGDATARLEALRRGRRSDDSARTLVIPPATRVQIVDLRVADAGGSNR